MAKTLTNEQAIATWSELQRLISVGAYEERSAEHYEADTYPEDGIEESVVNLETRARAQDLEFCYNHDDHIWSLVPIENSEEEPPDLVVEQMNRIEAPGYNELGEDEPYYVAPDEGEE